MYAKVLKGKAKFKSGGLVRITKEKLKSGKGYEQTFFTEIFWVVQVISRTPQPVCKLSDLCGCTFGDQFYNYELVKVEVSLETELKVDKIICSCYRTSVQMERIRQLVNSWAKASNIKKL
jgi:hypothetical protein